MKNNNFKNKMKKTLLLLNLILIINPKGFSQDSIRKGNASFNLGFSIPVGNYGSKDFDNNRAGFAKTGMVVDFSLGYKLNSKLGIIATWREEANSVDIGEYAQGLANYLGKDYPAGSTSVEVKSNAYSLSGILMGLNGTFLIADKLYFEPRILIGFSFATLPAMTTVAYEYDEKIITFVRESASTLTFSYIIGTGAKINVSKKICLMLNLDFYAAKAKWNGVQEIGIGHITETTKIYNINYKQNFSTINFSSGIGFRF